MRHVATCDRFYAGSNPRIVLVPDANRSVSIPKQRQVCGTQAGAPRREWKCRQIESIAAPGQTTFANQTAFVKPLSPR
jgi:hypothetical protein